MVQISRLGSLRVPSICLLFIQQTLKAYSAATGAKQTLGMPEGNLTLTLEGWTFKRNTDEMSTAFHAL